MDLSFLWQWVTWLSNFIAHLIQFLLNSIEQGSYLSIFVLMTIESSFIPFPSEIVMIPAGYLVYQQKMNLFFAFGAGLLGSLFGAMINYYLALFFGRAFFIKVGKYFFISESQLNSVDRFWNKHGEWTTFSCRLIPGVRQLISLPAGLARMPMARFLLFTSLGAGIWLVILMAIGYIAGIYDQKWQSIWAQYKTQITLSLLLFISVFGIAYWIYVKSKNNKMTKSV